VAYTDTGDGRALKSDLGTNRYNKLNGLKNGFGFGIVDRMDIVA
jgi:hypothetical protein